MYQEGGKYHFTHRSFQEYFCAVFFAAQKESFLERLGDFFENRHKRLRGDQTFSMLYDMIPDKVETCILIPFLQKLFDECDEGRGYWTFLEIMYPTIRYEKGEVNEWSVNTPKSYLFGSIIGGMPHKYFYTCDDLPEDKALLVSAFCYAFEDGNCRSLVNRKDIEKDYSWMTTEPVIVGASYALEVEGIHNHRGCEEMRDMLNNDKFIFKVEYNAARAYLERIKAAQKKDDDYFRGLL
jgi:hypothetical protein